VVTGRPAATSERRLTATGGPVAPSVGRLAGTEVAAPATDVAVSPVAGAVSVTGVEARSAPSEAPPRAVHRAALVTGASRGIGRAVALELAQAGFAVAVNYVRGRDEARAVVAAIMSGGGQAMEVGADVSDRAAVERMFAVVDQRFGRLDALVNNAGIGARIDAVTDIDDETWRRTLAVNLDGTFYCMRAAIPRLRAAGGGRIVNVSSGAARTGGAIGAHYAASKAGVLALTAKAARELAREGISVNAVLPSVIETDMLGDIAATPEARERLSASFPIGRFGRPEEVAAVVRFLCVEAPAYLTGEMISLRGARL
jgi:3-oxoacyl-[acyl-carrier protein] reductase